MNLDYLKQTRKNILGILDGLSDEQLNRIPEGLNNNLIWNAGHVVATCELLTYALAGRRIPSPPEFIDRYRKGTKPEGPASSEEIEMIKKALNERVGRLATDLDRLDWSDYKKYETSFGITLRKVGEGIAFNNMHEAMHIGTMLAIRNLVR